MTQGQQDWMETYEFHDGVTASGPAELQKVGVLKIGRPDARRVLVWVGGREGGAAVFRHTARCLAKAADDLQVWAVDRREQKLADLSGFSRSPEEATEYYLGGRYRASDSKDHLYAAQWGLAVLVEDLRRVILAACDGGRREVVLGGVSVGATAALSYAAWDFDGTPGHRDLAGLAVVDGGVHNAFEGAGLKFDLPLAAAEGWLAQIEQGAVFEDYTSTTVGLGTRPEDAAVWFQLAAQHALADPDAPAVLADRLPEAVRTDRKLTNAGLLGWLVDAERAHPSFSVRAGTLEDSGAWKDGGPTSLATIAEAFAGPQPGAWLWYTLNRVLLDYVAALPFTETDVTRRLGLRLAHTSGIDVPLYAFQSGLTNGTTGQAAASVAAGSRIPELALYSDTALTHQDVVYARWEDNRFLQTLSQWLRTLPARDR